MHFSLDAGCFFVSFFVLAGYSQKVKPLIHRHQCKKKIIDISTQAAWTIGLEGCFLRIHVSAQLYASSSYNYVFIITLTCPLRFDLLTMVIFWMINVNMFASSDQIYTTRSRWSIYSIFYFKFTLLFILQNVFKQYTIMQIVNRLKIFLNSVYVS